MPLIRVDRPEALSDQAIEIVLEGFRPNEVVEVVSRRRDLMSNLWRGWARFRTGDEGRIDLTTQAPLDGSYDGVSPMGLLWSMEMIEARGPEDPSRGYHRADQRLYWRRKPLTAATRRRSTCGASSPHQV